MQWIIFNTSFELHETWTIVCCNVLQLGLKGEAPSSMMDISQVTPTLGMVSLMHEYHDLKS